MTLVHAFPILQFGLRFCLAILAMTFGLAIVAPQVLVALVRFLRAQPRPDTVARFKERRAPWTALASSTSEPLDQAFRRRAEVAPHLRDVERRFYGWTMLILGIVLLAGLVDAVIASVLFELCIVAGTLYSTLVTKRMASERRAASLQQRSFPAQLRWSSFVAPLLLMPFVASSLFFWPPLIPAIVLVTLVAITAAAWWQARTADRALFGHDVEAEKYVDEWWRTRGTQAILMGAPLPAFALGVFSENLLLTLAAMAAFAWQGRMNQRLIDAFGAEAAGMR